MATTGELPPNARSGHVFIHDPKVAHLPEVKGQIKLRFRAINGKQVVVIRSFQLTQKAAGNKTGSQQFKAIEGVVRTTNERGESSSMSHRCADLDKQIPELMGVSKAVLENVIFCHQEDSNWPLADPKTLKEKFDDIFAATRYTKALEAIRKFKTEQTNSVKDYKRDLDVLQTHMDHAHKIKDQSDECKNKIVNIKGDVEELQRKARAAEEEIHIVEARLEGVQELYRELDTLKVIRGRTLTAKEELYRELEEEYSESDAELEQLMQEFEQKLRETEREKVVDERKIASLRDELNRVVESIQSLTSQHGKMQAYADQHQLRLAQSESLREKLSREFGLSLAGKDGDAFLAEVKGVLIRRQHELESLSRKHKAEEDAIQDQLNEQTKQYTSTAEKLEIRRAQVGSIEGRRRQLQRELEQLSVGVSESRIQEVAQEIEKTERELQRLQESNGLAELDHRIEERNKQRHELQYSINKLSDEIRGLEVQGDRMVKLDVKRNELKSTESKLSQLVGKIEPILQTILRQMSRQNNTQSDAMPAPHEYDSAMAKLTQQQRAAVEQLRRQTAAEEKILSELDGRISLTDKSINSAQLKMEANSQQIQDELHCSVTEYNPHLEHSENQLIEKRKTLAMAESAKVFYEKFLDRARRKHMCPMCERGLHPDTEMPRFIESMNNRLAAVPDHLAKTTREVTDVENTVNKMKRLRPLFEEYLRLQQREIQNLQATLSADMQQKEDALRRVGDLQAKLDLALKIESDLSSVVPDCREASRLHREVQRIGSEIRQTETTLQMASGGVSLEEARAEKQAYEKKSESLNRDIEQLRKDKDMKTRQVSALQTTLNDLHKDMAKMESQRQKRSGIETELKDLQMQSSTLTQEVEVLRVQLAPFEEKVQTLQTRRDSMRNEARRREQTAMQGVQDCQRQVESLAQIQTEVSTYEEANRNHNLQRVESELRALKEKQRDMESQRQRLVSDIEQKNELLSKQDLLQRNLKDNIKYRKVIKDLAELNATIERKQRELGIADDQAAAVNELDNKRRDVQKVKEDRSRKEGILQNLREQARSFEVELRSEQYRNIDDRHRDKLIQYETTLMANSDLERYYQALDKALLKYHSVKMEEINKIIKELWQVTYRGNDIDTIEIRSDPGSTTSRSSYNYRVVMKKADAELDMRGRCSAGQKVLACLVIRLALAETFCLNCGILALDEPTTNLDRANVEGLAQALADLINARRQQENFQLVVITHDEDFVQLIGRSEHTDYYWRVSKDEGAHSRIERQDIAAL
eukprot:GILJ01009725.1.p1 GENE.GILJ01009725.1~~GILJ01009725.1.p1  ORF type:complete len:1308 (+),score=257.68 GILJ01009725.1:108-3926(+)